MADFFSVIESKKQLLMGRVGAMSLLVAGGAFMLVNGNNSVLRSHATEERKKLVILGSGWGAMSLLQNLKSKEYDVTLISPRNYFLFTPLLTSVTVGTIESRSITDSMRNFLRKSKCKGSFIEAQCTDIDPEKSTVICQGYDKTIEVPYDYLVVAVGAVNNTFGVPGVEKYCNFLKEVDDAMAIRKKVVDCLENASLPGLSQAEIKKLLHFVIVGGGPKGVEFAAELHDFVVGNVSSNFPHLKKHIQISLIQCTDHILNTYDSRISSTTEKHFQRNGIEVKTNSRVTQVEDGSITIKHSDSSKVEQMPFGVCVWSTGIGTSPFVSSFRNRFKESDHQPNKRAIMVNDNLKVNGSRNIWAIGDCARVQQQKLVLHLKELFQEADLNGDGVLDFKEFSLLLRKNAKTYPQIETFTSQLERLFREADADENGTLEYDEFKEALSKVDQKLSMLPATAQVASQQGRYLGKMFSSVDDSILNTSGTASTTSSTTTVNAQDAFRYKHFASLAYIGDNASVADLGFTSSFILSGFGAWWLWRSVYLSKQFTMRTKCLVAFDWSKTLVFGRDVTRN